MTAHDLMAAQADIALDPLAGCLGEANAVAAREFVEQVRAAKPSELILAPKGMTMERAAYLSNLARAHVSRRTVTPCLTCSTKGLRDDCPTCAFFEADAKVRRASRPHPSETPAPPVSVTILALDLGTKTGYALRRRDGTLRYGTEVFTPRASWTPGQKWQRYRAWLSKTITEEAVDLIVFEDVKAHGKGAVLAAHAYGGFRAMLEMVADQHRVRLLPVGVGTIKKHWTGKGNANKDAMLAQAKARGFRPETDNDADALAILHWAVEQEASR